MSSRAVFGLGALVCAALLGYGYFLEHVQGLEPCPLCLVQRAFYYLVGGVFLVGALHGPRRGGTVAYAGLAGLFALGGAAVAGRQVWLQHLPADKVPACGPDLFFMMENFPLSRTLTTLFTGTGECAVVDWTFLGLSIAEWSLAWFLALAALCVALIVREYKKRGPDGMAGPTPRRSAAEPSR
jgi:protein dithiol:quinone oxidoreductase